MAICVINSNAFCVEDITNIENYEKAVNSEEKYACHHRLETHTSDGERRKVDLSKEELIALGMYYHRPAEELIYLTNKEHISLHHKGKKISDEQKKKLAEAHKGVSPSNKGVPMTDEQKKKSAEAHKGTHWYNNGEVNVQAKECPEGFVKGRLCKLADVKRAYY